MLEIARRAFNTSSDLLSSSSICSLTKVEPSSGGLPSENPTTIILGPMDFNFKNKIPSLVAFISSSLFLCGFFCKHPKKQNSGFKCYKGFPTRKLGYITFLNIRKDMPFSLWVVALFNVIAFAIMYVRKQKSKAR